MNYQLLCVCVYRQLTRTVARYHLFFFSSSLQKTRARFSVFKQQQQQKKKRTGNASSLLFGFYFSLLHYMLVYYIDTICVLFYFIFETALIIIFFSFLFLFFFFVNNFEIFLRLFLFYFCFRSLFFVYSLFTCVCLFILFFFCILVACRRSGGCWSTELTTKRVAAATAVATAASELGRAGDASSGSDSVSSRLAG